MANEIVRAKDLSAPSFQAMLTAFDSAMGKKTQQSVVPAIRRLPQLMPAGESLVVFAQALMTQPRKGGVVLAATSSQLMAYSGAGGEVVFQAPRETLSVGEFRVDRMFDNRLTLNGAGQSTTFKQVLPGPQADRIFVMAGGTHPRADRLDLLSHGEPADPGSPPLAAIWNLALYGDRIIDQHGRHLPFAGGDVQAMCETAGNIAATRGRDLAAKGVGTLLFGPIGLFAVGNAKERQVDKRELYLLIEGPGWAYTQKFVPDLGGPLRQFAQTVNVVARQHRGDAGTVVANTPAPQIVDPLARLRELGSLRDEGILSEEEFAAQKARILAQM